MNVTNFREVIIVVSGYVFCFSRSDLGQRVERVLRGFIEENCPLNSRTVRIFLSSTFTGKEWHLTLLS